ncbi:MAG TPA: HAMP domain-containing histidine kinase [Bacteroidetes bacterium]|nr:HAMP domain-containing histidine kinase [Bacteroidota bacterium]
MKKWATGFIIVLVTLATIGLMIIQVYWIKDAVKVKQALFYRDVNQAMTKVVYGLEKMRLQDQVRHQKKLYRQEQSFLSTFDSLNQILYGDSVNFSSPADFNDWIKNSGRVNNAINQLTLNWAVEEEGNFYYNRKAKIDSLITKELRLKQINTRFEYGIYNPATHSMILQRTGKFPEKLLNESYVYNLSTLGSFYSFPKKLLIYFPNEQKFIVSQLWRLLVISIFLFTVIIFSFSFSIYIIKRQKRLSVMKNDFINNMTHEFKTPISTIALACEALKDKDIQKSEPVYNSYINVINEENKRLGTMAEQILQSAVMDKGQLKMKKVKLDMHTVIQNAVNSKQIVAKEKGGSIELQLKATKSELLGDRIHLTNLMTNLIDNALKYNLNKPHLIINTVNRNDSLLIRVQDNGIGISKPNQKKIFEKLYRVPTGNVHDFKGFGLGLNYVKATAEMHHGTITVDSEPGKGSTFTIQLPIN